MIPEALVARRSPTGASPSSRHRRRCTSARPRWPTLADGFIALPGGLGTFEELCEILTWSQLGLHAKPVVLLDVEAFWAPFVALLESAVAAGFLRPTHRDLAHRAASVAEALSLLDAPAPAPVHKWIDKDET